MHLYCPHVELSTRRQLTVQLELHAHEQLDKAWRRLAKREAKAVQANAAHTPAAKQPEAVFLPEMLDEFLQVRLVLHRLQQEHAQFVFVCICLFKSESQDLPHLWSKSVCWCMAVAVAAFVPHQYRREKAEATRSTGTLHPHCLVAHVGYQLTWS